MTYKVKSLKDISWQVSEDTYRQDNALSYSTLAKFERAGFNDLAHLFDRIETPSLTFGSAVDSIITGGEQEFNDRFIVADFPDIPDTIIKIVRNLFKECSIVYNSLADIPDNKIIEVAAIYSYQNNWKPETRAKVIKEKGNTYYNLLYLTDNKTLINSETYQQVLAAVRALKESESTKFYFADNDPFDDSVERLYQLKFKATLNGIDYRCMADLIIVDYNNKTIQPVDLKTSSHTEWDFYKSFIDWDYQIQARLYWRIIKDNCDRDEYFKDFKILPYKFIVVNKTTLTPLVWGFDDTFHVGLLTYGRQNSIQFRDPEVIGEELTYYLKCNPRVPMGIKEKDTNNLINWLNTL